MVKAQPFLNYYGYRFHALFYRDHALDKKELLPVTRRIDLGDESYDEPIGFSIIDHSPAGLELWTAHLVDEPLLFTKLEGVTSVEVILLPRPDEGNPARVITYGRLASSRALGVSIKPRVVKLDATDSMVALDGVLFEDARVMGVEHRVVELP